MWESDLAAIHREYNALYGLPIYFKLMNLRLLQDGYCGV